MRCPLGSELCLTLTIVLVISTSALAKPKRDANKKFKLCCARQQAADRECKRQFCDFNVLSQNNALQFVHLCAPRGSTISNMWDCVTSKKDHSDCCKAKKVPKECIGYCSHKTVPADHLKHLFCLQLFNPIRDCFRSHLEHHPNIFGDE